MNLIIDIGNSSTKISVFREDTEVYSARWIQLNYKELSKILDDYNPDYGIISCVGQFNRDLVKNLEKKLKELILMNPSTLLPFTNKYKTRETLGNDRLAGVAGALQLYPAENILIIDAGTAITYDILTDSGEYIGGNISPGLQMRYTALNNQTRNLPLLNPEERWENIGSTTSSAIIAGVQNGIIFEIDNTIEMIMEQFVNLKTIVTGGDAGFFDNKLKKPIFVISNLISVGLNSILKYNVENR